VMKLLALVGIIDFGDKQQRMRYPARVGT
jgi:hypothetical protein